MGAHGCNDVVDEPVMQQQASYWWLVRLEPVHCPGVGGGGGGCGVWSWSAGHTACPATGLERPDWLPCPPPVAPQQLRGIRWPWWNLSKAALHVGLRRGRGLGLRPV